MTKIIGLTGGIGSGKTTVANFFSSLGIPVYIADEEAKKITDHAEVISKIREHFPGNIFDGGKLNRKKLGEIVFDNPEKLKILNGIIHPAVKADFGKWVDLHRESPFVIKETAILFETGTDKDCDFVITVTAPLQTRIERVVKRDKTTSEEVRKRIENQLDDAVKISRSDFVIHNIEASETEAQCQDILKKLQNF